MPHVELHNVTKRYSNGSEAVRGVSFTAEKGEFVVLVGASGCGKWTTLRMIAGLEEISGGDISIAGKRVNDLHPKDRDVAMVFQNYALYPHLTVYENIAFPLTIRKAEKSIIEKEVRAAADMLAITRLLERKPKELSGGERQRVALGRAIVRKPQVFLFDEPLSNLDAALRTEMRTELKSLQRRLATTMVYVTHDQTEAMTMGDKIVVMNNGSIEQTGTPTEIYNSPITAFVARFLGSPTINMIAGSLQDEDGKKVFAAGKLKLPVDTSSKATNVILGVRPELLQLTEKNNSNSITGTVELVERLGSTTHCYISSSLSENGTLSVTLRHHDRIPNIGDEIAVSVSGRGLHLFDRATGKSIY
ncbi:MAG TPA: sn-glycerol-3-phosphate ABC transporter ATP-binding protein UgpC [Candidatus Kapabacteria bacterium]|nr:sn-glycerol-3-phosphate ABC transporter ATP-binding protein UgpC [Candidatus Kapabacteria bacterium]